ncbi:MAG: PIN domain-containing protein, partial [Bacilli bacterium]|nr:PIN domain-containing protein [Bacilli bacterium]
MKILVDTNVVLDVLSNRSEFLSDSLKVLKLCEIRKITCFISSLSISNIVYILQKELDENKIKTLINNLFLIFEVVDLKADDIKKAIDFGFTDFEDAFQSACAKRVKADYIVT